MSEKRPDEQALSRVLKEIEDGRIRVYRDFLNQPWVDCDHPELRGMRTKLFAEDFRAWFAYFISKELELLLREREINRILKVLAGQSLGTGRRSVGDPALIQLMETEPVVATVVEFMHDKPRYETTMDRLWLELSKFSKERGINRLGKRRFPGGPHVLSRKLGQMKIALAQIGVDVNIRRSNGSKVTLVGRMDGSCSEASTVASADNSLAEETLHAEDARKQRILKLESLRQATTNHNTRPEDEP
jgi:hypothetical protein